MKALRLFLVLSLFSIISIQLSIFLVGCTQVKAYSQKRQRHATISSGKLEGMEKADVLKQFGRPQAASKSGVSECWYYAQPREVWIWFNAEGKVDHWEVQ